MMHSDMEIKRDLEADGSHHILGDSLVDCTIKDQITQVSRCPAAATLAQAGTLQGQQCCVAFGFYERLDHHASERSSVRDVKSTVDCLQFN